jgi:hypothetical protein
MSSLPVLERIRVPVGRVAGVEPVQQSVQPAPERGGGAADHPLRRRGIHDPARLYRRGFLGRVGVIADREPGKT